ncbi:hypothetical protein ARSEF1564_004246 [Beauveria bassiana]
MTRSLDNLRTQNNQATTNSNMEEGDTEMTDTAEEDDFTTPPQEDPLPALGGDEDMRDIEQEQLQSNACAIEAEEDIEIGRAEEVPNSQEQANEEETQPETLKDAKEPKGRKRITPTATRARTKMQTTRTKTKMTTTTTTLQTNEKTQDRMTRVRNGSPET